jgi:apolipoprotein N-acyltransferase
VALAVGALAGLLATIAHPPVGFGYAALATVPVLLVGLLVATADDDAPRVGAPSLTAVPPLAAGVGYVAGLATFLPMLHWITISVGGAAGPLAGYGAWLALGAFLALWYALAAAVIAPWVRSPWVVLVAPLVWTGIEAWRNRVPFTGFGWGSFADAQADTVFLPVVRVVGANGLTLLVALIGALAFVAAHQVWRAPRSAPDALRAAAPWGAGLVAATLVPVLAAPAAPPDDGRTVDVLMVQGNDLEHRLGTPQERHLAIAERTLALTRDSVDAHGQPDLTIWPESAIDRDPWGTGAYLDGYLAEGGATVGGGLIAGVILDGDDPASQFENTLLLVDADGEVVDRYTKRRYVPFGEYIPWRHVLEALPVTRAVPRDGVPGSGPATISTDAVDVAPIICFETLFGDLLRDHVVEEGAGLVVAATNDAAFGRSAEPPQHVDQSRVRAVETGRWVAHAALSGSSALIDPDGRIHESTGLFEQATIRADVPVVTATTPYLEIGDVAGAVARWVTLALIVVVAVLAVRARRRGPA